MNIPVSGRNLNQILALHGLPPHAFEGAAVYDLGCGRSDIAAELGDLGIRATITGFDIDDRVLGRLTETETIRASLDSLPVEDESADIVIATYSLPLWGRNAHQIASFFAEAVRAVRVNGLLSVYPVTAHTGRDFREGWGFDDRLETAKTEARKIMSSSNWLPVNLDDELLSVRRIA
jgi:ubiquinone/menaquinone biosynthesis C-methylase UbiE